MASNLEVVISARDQFTATANRVTGSLDRMNASAGRVGRGVGQVASGLSRLALVAGGVAATGLFAAARAGATFEAQLNTINTIARATPGDLAAIGDGIRTLARQGRGDLADLTAGFYDILSAGITDAAKAQGVLDAATRLAIGGLSTTAEAVDILTTAINAYGQDASTAGATADLFAKAIELGKVKADEIAASFANVAPIAAQTGINIEEVAAAYAALTAQGTPAAEVTTQMARAILDLLSPNKELNELQEKTKQNFMEIAREKGLVVALQAMRDAVKGDDQAFKDLFGRVEGYKFALQTTGPQQEKYNAALAAMGDAAGTATAQMGERTKGLAFAVQRFKNNLRDAGITLSTGFLPALERSIDKFSAFLGLASTQEDLRRFGEDIGKAIEGIDWKGVLEGAKTFVGLLKTALTLLGALPDQIKLGGAALVTAFNAPIIGPALGQVGKGIGNIGLGLLSGAGSLAGGKAGMAAGLLAQPVRVVNWPVGFGAGGVGGPGKPDLGWFKLLIPLAVAAAVVQAGVVASGVTDPRHQQIDPKTGRSRTFRGTNVAAEQIANLERSLAPLAERAAGGDRMAARQLESVKAEIARLRGTMTGPALPEAIGTAVGRGVGAGMTDIGREIAAAMAQTHGVLDTAIGGSGGAFLRAGAKAGTIDENAGKLVALFQTSTNPSLKSMRDNLAVLQGLAAKGDPQTRKLLSDDIRSLAAMIATKLDEVKAAMAPFAVALDPNSSWRRQEMGATVTPADVSNSSATRQTYIGPAAGSGSPRYGRR